MERQPSEPTDGMFLSHNTLRLLEDEVWIDLQDQIERGVISQEQAERNFINWRADYIDGGMINLEG